MFIPSLLVLAIAGFDILQNGFLSCLFLQLLEAALKDYHKFKFVLMAGVGRGKRSKFNIINTEKHTERENTAHETGHRIQIPDQPGHATDSDK